MERSEYLANLYLATQPKYPYPVRTTLAGRRFRASTIGKIFNYIWSWL